MTEGLKSGLLAALLASTAATGALAEDVIVYHNWSSGPEVAALNVLKSHLEEMGHAWTDVAIPHDTGSNVSLINLVTGGNPPNVFLESSPGFYRDLAGMGLARPLTDFYEEGGYLDHLPSAAVQSITVDGEIMKIPTAIHIDGMVYYSMDVAEAASVDPAAWTSLEDMFADFEKVEDAGFTFIAMGGNTFQAGYTFHPLLAAMAGPDIYKRFYADPPDPAVFDEPAVREAVEMFRRIAFSTDEGWVNRSWNDTTNTVIAGNALMQIHGDWIKGEWRANDKEVGTDFGCINIPSTQSVSVTVDSFGVLGGVDEETVAAEEAFAAPVVNPAVNAEFAYYKGASPVRLDVPPDRLDACKTLVLDTLREEGGSVQNPFYISDGDWMNSVWTTMFTFQGDSDMTTDEAIEMLKSEYEAIYG